MSIDEPKTTRTRLSWEGSPQPRPLSWLTAAVLMLAGAILLGIVVREFDDIQVMFMEDGPVETLQAAILAAAALVFGCASLKSTGARAFFCIVATFAITFAVTRELPRCDSAFTGGGMCLTGGWKKTIVGSAAAIALLAVLWRRREWTWEIMRLSNIRWLWPCFVVVGMLAGGEAAEHRVHVEIEESLELAAYLYVLAYGLWILRHTRVAGTVGAARATPPARPAEHVPGAARSGSNTIH